MRNTTIEYHSCTTTTCYTCQCKIYPDWRCCGKMYLNNKILKFRCKQCMNQQHICWKCNSTLCNWLIKRYEEIVKTNIFIRRLRFTLIWADPNSRGTILTWLQVFQHLLLYTLEWISYLAHYMSHVTVLDLWHRHYSLSQTLWQSVHTAWSEAWSGTVPISRKC